MSMITYANFLALAKPTDVELMTLLAMSERVAVNTEAEAIAINATMDRLFGAEVITRGGYFKERKDGVVWYVFEGRVDPVAATYLSRATKERIQLAQTPAPTPPV